MDATRQAVEQKGKEYRDFCKENKVNCAVFIEWFDQADNRDEHAVTIQNYWTTGSLVSPVLQTILNVYDEAQAMDNHIDPDAPFVGTPVKDH
jgi:hypothetical protein